MVWIFFDAVFRDGAQDDGILQADGDDRPPGDHDTHRDGAVNTVLIAVFAALIDRRDIDDDERLILFDLDTGAFLRVKCRIQEVALDDAEQIGDLVQLVMLRADHIDPAARLKVVHGSDLPIDRHEIFRHWFRLSAAESGF